MSSPTTSSNLTSSSPLPKRACLARSSSICSTTSTSSFTSSYTQQFATRPLSLPLTRSLSASSTYSTQSRTSQPSSPFLELPSRYESRHPSELVYRRMPDSPKPHYFYERPDFFTPKRSAPKAPASPRAKVLFIDEVDFRDDDEQ